RLAVAPGGAPATLSGLAGLGDLVLTCTGSLSRNRQLGIALTRGRTVAAVERETRMVAEGVRTVTSALALARRHSVSMPICEEVGAVLFEGKAPTEALTSLLERPLRPVGTDCVFGAGNEHKTPPEILAGRSPGSRPNEPGWSYRVVANKFPALRIEGELEPAGEGLFDRMNGVGAHEVVIETPEHT